MSVHTELSFEEAISGHLTAHGYHQGNPGDFDVSIALDPVQLLRFIQATQAKKWLTLTQRHGSGQLERRFLDRVAQQLDEFGTLHVLRQGVTDHGVKFDLCFFKPAHDLTPRLAERYQANRLSVTRQVRFNPKTNRTLDLVLFVNGIPVATAELKSSLTNQNVNDAMRQYREDRDPNAPLLRFKRRALVHFAVDTDRVFMATKLQGPQTEFLPFNRGRGSGKEMGAGNPDNPNGHRTSYLWESVWQFDSWLDILHRFIHLQHEEKPRLDGSVSIEESVIFPRYHQLGAVRAVEADARSKGSGRKYLIQHSAGSGKSNTIAWLAHGMFRLHDESNKLLFDTIVVVTDRKVLDRQLQGTVAQFEQTPGIVVAIDRNSSQLAETLVEGRHIVVTTLQKFPFIMEKVRGLGDRTFAVIIDEAHSSQTGTAARKMRVILSDSVNPADATEEIVDDWEDELGDAALATRPNLSFVALTATPKFKTIEIFGTPGTDGKPHPFHVYSMRQAIEEKFILDVLRNYTTYGLFWRLESKALEDPEVDTRRARAAIARFISLHPYNIAQKTQIIIEHFRQNGRHKIGGRAKAMVVTRSRLHAVRYKLAFDKYIRDHGYDDLKVLVAFSGEVMDPELGERFTESAMNGFPESRLPKEFRGPEFQVLLVAEKYQTGYDQPLLHSMYVDKRLDGVKAVQTLCRLNRIIPGKEDTFVLDFVNKAEDIARAFAPYFDATEIVEPTDPNLLYDLKTRLDGHQIYSQSEIEAVSGALGEQRRALANASLNAALDPAVKRFMGLDVDEREQFKHLLVEFTRLYSFLLNVLPYTDPDLDKFFEYARFLHRKLPQRELTDAFPVEEYLELSRYRLFKRSESTLNVDEEEDDYQLHGPSELGTVRAIDVVKQPLSGLIAKLNELFGAELTENDALTFVQLEEDLAGNERLAEQAKANDPDHYAVGFESVFSDSVVDRVLKNQDVFRRIQADPEFRKVVMDYLRPKVYQRQREKTEMSR